MGNGMRPAVFLDRDGVLVETEIRRGKPFAPRSLAEFTVFADAKAHCDRLKQAGFILVVVSNQPDVGNGLVARSVVEAMNEKLRAELPLDAVKICYHSQDKGCACRKPAPGLLLEAAKELILDPAASFMIGDRWLDIVAGKNAGCHTILIDRDYAEKEKTRPDATVRSLGEAVDVVLG